MPRSKVERQFTLNGNCREQVWISVPTMRLSADKASDDQRTFQSSVYILVT